MVVLLISLVVRVSSGVRRASAVAVVTAALHLAVSAPTEAQRYDSDGDPLPPVTAEKPKPEQPTPIVGESAARRLGDPYPAAAPWDDTRPQESAVPSPGAGVWSAETERPTAPGVEPGVGIAGGLDLIQVDVELDELDGLVREAHFRTALAIAESTRRILSTQAGHPEVDVRRVRLEILAATAAVAVEETDEARGYMRAALEADPTLELDPNTTSPKVLAVFAEAQRSPSGTTPSDLGSPGLMRPVERAVNP